VAKKLFYPASLVRVVRVTHGKGRSEDIALDPCEPFGRVFKRLRAQHAKASIKPVELANGQRLE
jgi:hypothetical protein